MSYTSEPVDSFQYPAGHYGHLKKDQQDALSKFKVVCQERGYFFAKGDNGRTQASHDDETLLRYLRARKFSPEEAFKQFKDTEDWRKENRIADYYDVIDVDEYENARRLYPQWIGRRDKRGIPVYVYEIVHLSSKAISTYASSLSPDKSPPLNSRSSVPPRMMRLFALYENLTRFILPMCSGVESVDRPYPETPISQSNNIVDVTGVGLRQFWNLKAHMQDASTLATAYYPETLDRIFIVGAPSFFPTVWTWVKRWFDPITVSKIFILAPNEVKSTLEKFISPANIPKKYGGELDYEYGMTPNLDPAILDALKLLPGSTSDSGKPTTFTMPKGPVKWQVVEPGHLDAIAIGSEAGQPRRITLARMKTNWTHTHGIGQLETFAQNNAQATEQQAAAPAPAPAAAAQGPQPVEQQPVALEVPVIITAAPAAPSAIASNKLEPSPHPPPPPPPLPEGREVFVTPLEERPTPGFPEQTQAPMPMTQQGAEAEKPAAANAGVVASASNAAGSVVGGVLNAVGLGWGAAKKKEGDQSTKAVEKKLNNLRVDEK